MSQKKEGPESTENKPGVKIQDLSPKKDAKGGGARPTFNPNAGGGSALNRGGSEANRGGSALEGNTALD